MSQTSQNIVENLSPSSTASLSPNETNDKHLKMFLGAAFVAEDCSDATNIFSIDDPYFDGFSNYFLTCFSALIWLMQMGRDSWKLYYTLTSKWKYRTLLTTAILGFGASVLTVITTFIGTFLITFIATAPFWIAIASSIWAIRQAFRFGHNLKKSFRCGLHHDRKTSVLKLCKQLNINPYEQSKEPLSKKKINWQSIQNMIPNDANYSARKKLLRLALQAEATEASINEPDPWKQALATTILTYEQEKTREHGIELIIISTVAVGSFLLLIPPLAPVGGFLIIAAAITALTLSLIKFCHNRYHQWRVDCARQNNPNLTDDDLMKMHCDSINLTDPSTINKYWQGLPTHLQQKNKDNQLLAYEKQQQPSENRGNLIYRWYCYEFFKRPTQNLPTKKHASEAIELAKSTLLTLARFSFYLKKVLLITGLLIPIILTALAVKIYDSCFTSTDQDESKQRLLQ